MRRYRVEEATVQLPDIVQVDATDEQGVPWWQAREGAVAIIDLQLRYLRRERRRLKRLTAPEDCIV